jgi:hypothetical protein
VSEGRTAALMAMVSGAAIGLDLVLTDRRNHRK